MSTAQPLDSGVKLDMSTAQPLNQGAEAGFLDKEIPLDSAANATLSGVQSVGRGVRGAFSGLAALLDPRTDESGHGYKEGLSYPVTRLGAGLANTAKQAAGVPDAIRTINASPDPTGAYLKVAQDTAGEGAGQALTALATEGVARAPIGKLAQSAKVVAAPAAEAAAKLPVVDKVVSAAKAVGKYKHVPGQLADIWKTKQADALGELPTTGAKPASQTGEALGTIPRGSVAKWMKDSGAPLPEKPAPELLQSQPLATGPKAAPPRPSDSLGKIPARGSIAKAMKDPGAPLPEKPTPELLKSQPLATGPKPAPPRPSDSLGTIPVRGSIAKSMQEPTPAPIKRGSLKQLLGDQLEEGLGATKLDPKTPLRQQLNTPEVAPDMPQGHTPVQSSALRSYKYDAAAKEFHARGTGGDTVYVYGDVSPEAAQAFEQAESKGKAWQAMKQNPLVAKIVNGKRISTKPDVGRGSISQGMGQK